MSIGNSLFNRFSYVFYRTETESKKERKRGKKRGRDRRSREKIEPFRRRSAAVSPPSLATVPPTSANLGCVGYPAVMVASVVWRGSSSQQATPTPKRLTQSRLLELERHVAINGRIPMTIAPGAEKPISPHVVRFSQAIGMCVRKTFPVRCLKWANVGREYIERLFVLDFNDRAMNRFVEHQMLTTFKEFRTDCHRHFKKYSDPEEARANPPNALVGRDKNWYFLCDHYISRAFQKQPYNHSSGSKSFLQRQYELTEDAHNQMLELQSQPTPEGSQPLSEDEICDQVLGRRPRYSKGLGWGPKPKARRTASASSSSTSCSQST
ncbi:CACTA en-spm transposon protein [Cucumis melo var. makuwa]|uniref:CACTA en-spm transposon protein n=1 Tax=Cucumis melo var. makuwa TaxID=1194695 RepID=A0A5D3C333_CUCMM|nr:CACTA en-spm transposon protein [Cucumis melo var. makuwa]